MSATELIDRIKALPREDQWTVFRFLSEEFEAVADARLYDEFTQIGSDAEGTDVGYAIHAQRDIVRHG